MNKQQKVYDFLQNLGISYQIEKHPPVYTIEDMEQLKLCEKGNVVKNLFLRDAKGKRHFLVVLGRDKKADLKQLGERLGSSKLSFASEERLAKYLGLEKGSVTPLGVINDEGHSVEVVFDKDLVGDSCLGVHPNENTATLYLSFEDLKRVIDCCGNVITYVEI